MLALGVDASHGFHRSIAASSIDIHRYLPQLLVREPDTGYRYVLQWIDNVAHYSTASVSNASTQYKSMYKTMTPCLSESVTGLSSKETNHWRILQSHYMLADLATYTPKCTHIQWPDPPSMETLWSGTKNFMSRPAMSKLAGYLKECRTTPRRTKT
ncbi:hypothetical protein QLX08_005305 [Tetragonisca angustula]|uniref:Uncharacterized protein n=1 Tax=Tetragonisca angustula TaxID=166442 RepID=A0AAW1A1F6_9HYME